MRDANHRKILDEVSAMVADQVEFFAPRCSPWAQAGSIPSKAKATNARKAETPVLQWVAARGR